MRNAKQVRMRNTMVKAQASDQLTPVDHLVAQHWKLAEIFLLFFAALWNVVIKEVWNMDVNPNRFGTFHFAVWVNLIWSISYPAYCLLIFTLNLSVSAPALKQVIHKEPKLQFDNPWKCRLWNQGFTQSLHVLWMLVTPCTVYNAHIEQSKFLRVVCAWTYLKKSLNVSNITYFYPNTNNPEENRENSTFMNLKL